MPTHAPHLAMNHVARKTSAQGQATVEFLVALLVMVPFFFGMYYFARYADVKHSAIQASRYAAFERAADPSRRAKTPAQLAEETRARFFVPVSVDGGKISYRQSTVSRNPDGDRVPLWSDASYKPLLANYSDINVREVNAGNLNTGLVGKLQSLAAPVFGLPAGGVIRSEVTVSLQNITHFDVLQNINIGLPGATAIGTSGWNASGAKSGPQTVCGAVGRTVAGQFKPIKLLADGLGTLMSPFERHTPDFGRILPDYVPPGSVQTTGGNPVPYSAQNGNKC